MCTGDESCGNGGLFGALFPGKGEVGAFRVLKFLFENDDSFRERFLHWLEISLKPKISLTNQLANSPKILELECRIDDHSENCGRIDGAIESSDYVLAIEGKFGAPFQNEQLTRYQNWLLNKKDGKNKVLFVIVPSYRVPEVLTLASNTVSTSDRAGSGVGEGVSEVPIAANNTIITAIETWESLVDCFARVKLESVKLNTVLSHWCDFLKHLCRSYDFSSVPDCFTRAQSDQVDCFLNAVYNLLTDLRYDFVERRLDPWGYSRGYRLFDRERGSRCNAWLGVVSNDSFVPDENPQSKADSCQITLATDFEVDFNLPGVIRKRNINRNNWRHEKYFYVIEPSKISVDHRNSDGWQKMLEPFRGKVAEICKT